MVREEDSVDFILKVPSKVTPLSMFSEHNTRMRAVVARCTINLPLRIALPSAFPGSKFVNFTIALSPHPPCVLERSLVAPSLPGEH